MKDMHSRRGLVVTSEEATGRICIGVFDDLGCRSTLVDEGVAALMAARKETPAVILIDIQLRDVPGPVALGWIRTDPELSSLPVVVLNAGKAEAKSFAALHPDGILPKPLQRAELYRTVAQLLPNFRAT